MTPMRLKAGFVAGAVALAITAVPAHAASTRAEYVAQVDPICQASEAAAAEARQAFRRNTKRLVRQGRARNAKKVNRLSRKAARNLNRLVSIEADLTTQIAAVPPAPADSNIVSAWLQDRRDAEALSGAAARALKRHKFKKFGSKLGRAIRAGIVARRRVKDFGFQYCV
jgi:hypothetical protein